MKANKIKARASGNTLAFLRLLISLAAPKSKTAHKPSKLEGRTRSFDSSQGESIAREAREGQQGQQGKGRQGKAREGKGRQARKAGKNNLKYLKIYLTRSKQSTLTVIEAREKPSAYRIRKDKNGHIRNTNRTEHSNQRGNLPCYGNQWQQRGNLPRYSFCTDRMPDT